MRQCHSSIKLMTYDAFPPIARTERTAQEGHCSPFRDMPSHRFALVTSHSRPRLERRPVVLPPDRTAFFICPGSVKGRRGKFASIQ